jgi:pyruvate formate lyase activating enzyme
MYTASKCIGAAKCIAHCPNDALEFTDEGIVTNTDLCNLCGKCAEVCPTKAFEMLGEQIPLTTLMEKIDKEAIFFDQSGGGVTFSGGEPLMHANYLLKILKACGKRFYHRVVDTTAFTKLETLLQVAEHTEMFLIDLKHMDSEKHKEFTGVSNEIILSNITELAKTNCEIIFRMPLIKGVNTGKENIENTAIFINSLNGKRKMINLLPYHNISGNKHLKLGDQTNFVAFEAPSEVETATIISIFKEFGIAASIGG